MKPVTSWRYRNMSLRFMPKDRQLLLLLGMVAVSLLVGVVMMLIIYQAAAPPNARLQTRPQKCLHAYLSCDYSKQGGLGTLLFQYASTLGLARSKGMTMVLPADFNLRSYFELSSDVYYQFVDDTEWNQFEESKASSYDRQLVSSIDPCKNSTVIGYLQAYGYFEQTTLEVVRNLQFKPHIQKEAQQFLTEALASAYPGKSIVDKLYIGIHVRRGDMVTSRANEYGYISPDRDYFVRAILRYQLLYNRPKTKLIFIVTSDDIPWCEANFMDIMTTNSDVIVYSRGNADYLDMAILSLCNHTIISSGSFSWWAGWLSRGNVTYFRGYPKEGSILDDAFSSDKTDYYPQHWIGLN